MVRQPKSLDEAKQIYREEKQKVTRSLDALIGSRILMAVLATFVLAFAVNLVISPDRMPDVGGLSVARVGLPTEVDFGFVGEQAQQAQQAALREVQPSQVQAFLNDNRQYVPIANAFLLGFFFCLLIWNMTVITMRRRFTRG